MGRELIERYAVFRKALEKADNCISSLGSDWSIIGNEDKLLKDDLNSQVDKAEISMPLCCALQIALVCLLRSWNVHPTAVVGHSSGESAAAFAAGALDMRSAIAVQYYRGLLTGRLAGTRSTKGSMMAAGLSLEDAERYLSKVTSGKAVVGCHNSPLSVTLSGDADAIDELEILLKVDGVFTRKLNVPTAFHIAQAKPPVLTSTNTRAIQEKLSNCTNVDTTTEYITKALTERLAQLMMLPVTDVDPNEPLSAYGVDSLVAVELRSWILKELSVQAGTAATTEASVDTEPDNGDNFDGINWDRLLEQGSNSLRQTLETGVAVSQEAANAMGNFNIQQFREVAVFCLLDNNLPMELLARPSFREMISLANPEAEAALWVSPRSVATYAMRLFQYMQPQIVCALSEAASKIHISFDGWTTKGGKRGFFGVVAHFANASGVIQDLPIALPHLAGSHTGDAIADTIKKTLQEYSIGSDKLGYFVLDNAANNDTAVSSLAHAYDFNAAHRRLRCGPHTLNLIGQAIIFGSNQEAYNNNNDEQLQTEEVYMQEWRQEGPLGVLIDVINHIKIFQTAANAELPARERLHVLEPVKPVVTRWNSYYAAFKRATQLQAAYNSYAEHYINALSLEDRRACQRGNKLPEAPSWMRSTGLTAADWAVITEYQDCLEPLKLATEKLEGRGKAGKYGAIYETIPVFEYVLGALEARTRSYEQVDFNPPDAPEDHLFVNLRAAWSKANDYYNKLDRSPAYYAATCLHPYYKYYCENSWVDKPEWLTSANAGFLQLWQSYKPQRTRPLSQTTAKPRHRGIDDVIGALVRRNKAQVEAAHDDEYERWRTQEPEWTSEQYLSDGHPVKYWIQLRSKYPCLSQFAIDILTIPASSCDCERLFSELGDLLEPRRRALGSELLAALQLVRSWRRAGFDGLYNNGDDEDKWSDVKDEEIVQQYDIEGWSTTP
ncbi:Polyketide synthase module [Pyrenophora tritici-repentis]|nr:Polyketide synthase module [Pyrenophora tritici-repentis]